MARPTPSDKPAQTCRRHSPPRLPRRRQTPIASRRAISPASGSACHGRSATGSPEKTSTFYETCKKTGQKIRVAGVRLDAGDAALVRMDVGGTDQSRVILFENGNWVMKPTRLIQVTPNPNWW